MADSEELRDANTTEDAPQPAEAAATETETKPVRKGIITALILFIKGIVVGVANIIPGVSGGTIAVVTGIFNPLIEAINTLFKKFVKNLKFLIPVGLGLVTGVVVFSKLIGLSLEKFPLQTGLFFVGLVIGSVPLILKKAHGAAGISSDRSGAAAGISPDAPAADGSAAEGEARKGRTGFRFTLLIPFVLCAAAVVALAIIQTYYSAPDAVADSTGLPVLTFGMVLKLFIGGVVSACAMVVPGVSGSLVLMLLGLYSYMLAIISALTHFSDMSGAPKAILCALPLGIGIIIGIFTIARLISFLFKKFSAGTYYGILGLLAGSVLALLISLNLPALTYTVPGVLLAAVTLAAGIAISYFSSKLES